MEGVGVVVVGGVEEEGGLAGRRKMVAVGREGPEGSLVTRRCVLSLGNVR